MLDQLAFSSGRQDEAAQAWESQEVLPLLTDMQTSRNYWEEGVGLLFGGANVPLINYHTYS